MFRLFSVDIVNAAENLSTARANLLSVQGRAGVGELPIETIITNALGAVLSFVGMIFLVFMVYAGFLWFTSQGEDEKIKKATSIIKTSIVGLILILSAGAITFFITNKLQTGVSSSGSYDDTGCIKKNSTFTCTDISTCVKKHLPDAMTQVKEQNPKWDSQTKEFQINVLRTYCKSPNCQLNLCGGDKWRVCCK